MNRIKPLLRRTAMNIFAASAVGLASGGLLAASTASAEPAGDAARGAKLFLQCRACHTVVEGEAAGVGPNLWGVVGSKAGARPGYHYSAALSGSGVVWDAASLDQWLTRPTALVAGTTMAFQGVAAPKSREDLIAYLETLGPKVKVKAEGKIKAKARTRRR